MYYGFHYNTNICMGIVSNNIVWEIYGIFLLLLSKLYTERESIDRQYSFVYNKLHCGHKQPPFTLQLYNV